jgi:HD-like signal output (HDOD) protein/CheY-like chemotaxis protein
MPTRILFVDDEPSVLAGIGRIFHSMRGEWLLTFASGGAEALRILEEQPHEVIVSDMRMPQMDGAQLLAEVRRRYPGMVRIILSGHSDQELILKSIGPTHQYLTKPCEPEVLISTIRRAAALSQILTDPRVKAVVAEVETLPSMPTVFTELVEELQRPTCSLEGVGEVISRDPGMTTQILHLVNSAFFGLRREISSPAAAVTYLGLTTVTSLVMTFHIFRQIDESCRGWLGVDRLWQHSMNTGAVAKAIAQLETKEKRKVDDAFVAGLVHDAGRLILAGNFPQRYREAMALAGKQQRPLVDLERELLGATHAEVGAYLVGIWGLPNSITEALAYHHCPRDSVGESFCPLTAVHAACVLESALHEGGVGTGPAVPDVAYLEKLGLAGRFQTWADLAAETLSMKELSS